MQTLADALRDAAYAVAHLGASATDIAALDDAALTAAQEAIGVHQRLHETYAVWVAGEIARRSHRDFGYDGLAQRAGFSTPDQYIQSVSHGSRAQTAKLVNIGTMMTTVLESAEPSWLTPIADGVAGAQLSIDAAEAIRRGLTMTDGLIPVEQLRDAAASLVAQFVSLNTDELFKRARAMRDTLDEAGIGEREEQRRQQRFMKLWRQSDGMYRGSFLLDPESGALIASAMDTALSPRRGGPRFVNPAEKASAAVLVNDPRTNEQLSADAFVAIVRLAIDADPGTFFGSRRPAVRVIVAEDTLIAGAGHGRIEGQPDPVSFETIERHLCDTGVIALKFDDEGQCVNVGRNQRLFTEKQRTAMAVRDGGCLFAGCEKPPSFCEAHHIDQWQRDKGKTDVADGILLCRFHHLLLHNKHWHVIRNGQQYWLRPPPEIDAAQTPVHLSGRNVLLDELRERRRSA